MSQNQIFQLPSKGENEIDGRKSAEMMCNQTYLPIESILGDPRHSSGKKIVAFLSTSFKMGHFWPKFAQNLEKNLLKIDLYSQDNAFPCFLCHNEEGFAFWKQLVEVFQIS